MGFGDVVKDLKEPKVSLPDILKSAIGTTPISLPYKVFTERFATPKQRRLLRHAETIGIAPALELAQLAEQVGVPLAKGEGIRGIDILGRDRSILEFPQAREILGRISKLGAKITPIPGAEALRRPIAEAVERAPIEPFAEAGRLGAKFIVAGGLRAGAEQLRRTEIERQIQTVRNFVKNKLPNVDPAKVEAFADIYTRDILSGRTVVPAELRRELGFLGRIGGIPRGRVPAKRIPPTPEEQTPIQRVIGALKEAKPLRKIQETLYTKERAERLAKAMGVKEIGEKGFYAELGKLKGELPRVQFESIRGKLSQEDIDSLFIQVKEDASLGEWDKITARAGLAKLFGEFGARVPTDNELTLLNNVFGKDFTKAVLDKRSMLEKIKEAGYQLMNIPRSIMASFDLSAAFRQGVFLVGRPKQFWTAFGKMFPAFAKERWFQAIQDTIHRDPFFPLARESRLAITELGKLTQREEAFMSGWAERIPVVGRVVRASGRAYTGFLNKLRFDVFKDLVGKADRLGLDPRDNKDLLMAISDFVNNATGRGSLGALERSAVALNTFLFSPRLLFARLNLLNPIYYVRQPPFVRKEALKSLLSFLGLAMTVLTLAKVAGAKVGTDPRSSDFGKIRIRDTRIDVFGGFLQYIVLLSRIITGQIVSSTTGKTITLGEGYRPLTRMDILSRFAEYKQAPVLSFITDMLRGRTVLGEEIKVPREVGKRFVPMVIADMYDILKADPHLFPISLLGVFGVGVQTYKGRGRRGFGAVRKAGKKGGFGTVR